MDHLAAALLVFVASSSDRLQSTRPQGMFGEGHIENHDHYSGLINKQHGSCCNGTDCRPTQARWNNKTNQWEALLQGVWRVIDNANLVLDDEWLQQTHHERWDTQAHICAAHGPGETARIYCLIPPGSGQ